MEYISEDIRKERLMRDSNALKNMKKNKFDELMMKFINENNIDFEDSRVLRKYNEFLKQQ